MRARHLALKLAVVSTVPLAATTAAQAQAPSASGSVALNATFGSGEESLQLTVSPGSMAFDLNAASPVLSDAPQTVSLTWSLASTRFNVILSAGFQNGTGGPALIHSNGSSGIPSPNVHSNIRGTYTPCHFNSTFATCGQVIIPTTSTQPFQTTFDLRIDKTGLSLVSGTYTGTLLLSTQAL